MQKLQPARRDSDYASTIRILHLDQAEIVGILPDRQPWTGCSPGFHHLLVASVSVCQPRQQIEDQAFDDCVGGHKGILARGL